MRWKRIFPAIIEVYNAATATRRSTENKCVPEQSLGTRVREGEGAAENLLFVPDHEMNHPGRIGNPEAIEIFPELFHFIAARDAVDLQIR